MKKNLIPLIILFTILSSQIRADIIEGNTSVIAGGVTLELDMIVDTDMDLVTLTMTGPSNLYYAFGFGSTFMSSGTYAIVMNGSGSVFEQSLGFHSGGTTLGSSITVVSNDVSGGIRTVQVTRAIAGLDGSYYTFPSTAGSIDFIFARGNGPTFGYHGFSNKGTSSLMTTLPVELSNISLKAMDDKVEIQWQTFSELNNEMFVVQRSLDGKSWIDLGNIKGKGNSNNTQNYQFLDNRPQPGINYYRLKQVDFDGLFDYSSIKGIEFYATGYNELVSLYPTISSRSVTIQTLKDFDGQARIQLLNNQFVLVRELWWDGDDKSIPLDISQLSNGNYFVIIKHREWIATNKLVKH